MHYNSANRVGVMATRPSGLSLQTILENQTTAVLWLDGALCLTYLNPAAETLLKLDARQVLGGRIQDCLPQAAEFAAALRRAAESREIFTQRELKLPLAERESVTVDCTATPVREHEGETPLLVELAPLDRHLRISRDDAVIAQHAANRVLARNLAHEIRNPLGGLRGAAQLLERRLPDAALKEYTGVIMKEADRLTALVDAMLGPTTPLQRSAVNVHELMEHVARLTEAEAPTGLKLKRDYDPSLRNSLSTRTRSCRPCSTSCAMRARPWAHAAPSPSAAGYSASSPSASSVTASPPAWTSPTTAPASRRNCSRASLRRWSPASPAAPVSVFPSPKNWSTVTPDSSSV